MAGKPLAYITCGPAYEPIDSVRRITNFATGEIGSVLSKALLQSDFDVVCFRGAGSSAAPPVGVDVRPFSTNDSIASALKSMPTSPDVIFHAAALCDYVIDRVDGVAMQNKISSRGGDIAIHLKPAAKILPCFRDWFPGAWIVGWKYELDGNRDDAIVRAATQIRETCSDACVVNGQAFGSGFGILLPCGTLISVESKNELAEALVALFLKTRKAGS
jgi:phosphopantothenoylcysteine synthetase/decarboxylase